MSSMVISGDENEILIDDFKILTVLPGSAVFETLSVSGFS